MINETMWTPTHFPSAMRSLNPSTRAKAIEIANRLLEQGSLDKQQVVALSVDQARKWARAAHLESINGSWQPRL
jgi:uncharacterized protein YdaT